jgi:ADP-ribose pyrophosphatase YjhB (NUDIX family)
MQMSSEDPARAHGNTWKENPGCHEASMIAEAMSTKDLSNLAFEAPAKVPTNALDAVAPIAGVHPSSHDAFTISSSSSSTCTRESDSALSDTEGHHSNHIRILPTPPGRNHSEADKINAKVSLRKTSRQGRSSQRWEQTGHETIRLVTGCVPILKGGKILLVSASRKPEWILPKGGWEQDEPMQESAVRETFEEAGVLGVLGPKLKEFLYETRKAKKRRLEYQELLTTKLRTIEHISTYKGEALDVDSVSLIAKPTDTVSATASLNEGATADTPRSTLLPTAPLSMEDLTMIRSQAQANAPKASDETVSMASTHSSAYSQVRLTLFPLYVSQVLDTWPEDGRFRRAVSIDVALELQASRPEFKAALLEVKERGLHLIEHP